MKKISLLLFTLIIIPCLYLFSGCGATPPTYITSISVSYNAEYFHYYTAQGNHNDYINIQYGEDIAIDPKDFNVHITFNDQSSTTVNAITAIADYDISISHNIPLIPTTPVGDYSIQFSTTSCLSDTIDFCVTHRMIELPVANPLTYNGDTIVPTFTFAPGDSDFLELVEYDSAVNVGNYSATFALRDNTNCSWLTFGDNITNYRVVEWSISPLAFAVPTPATMTYTGGAIPLELIGYDDTKMALSGTTTATTVTATPNTTTITLLDTTNTMWEDESITPKTIEWNITPARLTKPTLQQNNIVYNQSEQNAPIIDTHPNINITNISGTNCAEYTSVVSLIDATNYTWNDLTTTPFELIWNIVPATHTFSYTVDNTPLVATYGTMQSEVDFTQLKALHPGEWSFYSANPDTTPVGDVNNNGGANKLFLIYTDVSNNYQPYTINIPIRVTPAIVTRPTLSNSTFLYDGTQKSLTFTNLDTGLMTIENDTATNAGEYAATIRLKDHDNYDWADDTTNMQSIDYQWSIKAKELTITNTQPAYVFTLPTGTNIDELSLSDFTTLPFIINDNTIPVNTTITTAGDSTNGYTITFRITLQCWDDLITALNQYNQIPKPSQSFTYEAPINYTYPNIDYYADVDLDNIIDLKNDNAFTLSSNLNYN
ncbi:MAG: hypothetical protein IKC79_01865 [Clostridia bacterium]|nr:hypothetical protein [Clostridia bacterium]